MSIFGRRTPSRLVTILVVGSLAIPLGSSLTSAATAAQGTAGQATQPIDASVQIAAQQLASDYGVSLSDATGRILRQNAITDYLAKMEASDPDNFAGGWIDQAHGGALVVSTVGDPTPEVAQASAAGLGDILKLTKASDSIEQLRGLASTINGSMGTLGVSAAVDERDDQVDVAQPATPADSGAVSVAVQSLKQRYGGRLAFHTSTARPMLTSCEYMVCDPPLRGGLAIKNEAYPGADGYCTGGFLVHSNGAYYLLTAGHCGDRMSWTMSLPKDNFKDHLIGTTSIISYSGSITSSNYKDYQAVGVQNVSGWMPGNAIYVAASSSAQSHGYPTTLNESYTISGSSSPPSGGYLCHTGATTGTRCGQVAPDAEFPALLYFGAQNCGGDSGGPVFIAGRAYGITIATDADGSYATSLYDQSREPCGPDDLYYPINSVLNGLGVSLD